VSLRMDKIEYRAVKKFFVKERLTPNEINSKFIKVYGDSSPSFSTIKKWAAEFKRGRTSLEDDLREGLPKSATTPECNEKLRPYYSWNNYGLISEESEVIRERETGDETQEVTGDRMTDVIIFTRQI